MSLFSYRAINEDSKEVQGSIEAMDLDAAKTALVDLHLEPIEVSEAMRLRNRPPGANLEQPFLKTAYAFEGKDDQGNERRGTVQASTKRQAFDNIKHDQGLTLSMLSPLGAPATRPDGELAQWQSPRETATPATEHLGWTTLPELPASVVKAPVSGNSEKTREYYPLVSTFRLYAGWLLTWYGLFAAISYYFSARNAPLELPFLQGFSTSPLVISFMLAIFFFLMFSSLHRALHGGKALGVAASIAGVLAFAGARMLVV